MKKIKFVKMVGSGNDFVLVDFRVERIAHGLQLAKLAQGFCQRKTGIGADGLLVIEKSKKADFRMRVFNADGSEAEMCGNGLRCAVFYVCEGNKKARIETMAGIYGANVIGNDKIAIEMKPPKDISLDVPIEVEGRNIKANYIDTGVPHAVIFVEGLEKIDVECVGRAVRNHGRFRPRGANVDFIEVLEGGNIKMRTYERGVEGETLACGTGAVASAIICRLKVRRPSFKSQGSKQEVNVHTRGGVLNVSFKNIGGEIRDVYLEGEAKEIFRGEVNYV